MRVSIVLDADCIVAATCSGQRVACIFEMMEIGDINFQALFIVGASLDSDVYKLSSKMQTEQLEAPVRCRHESFEFQAKQVPCCD